ncbi:three-helix bundle dimerization domain-containing protein [Rhodococcus sp. T7]|uniref:three-helix bundle dimerization domain-containing protein n=1 Tax=Rhodococcus sp. T7 TaxID=627444 RepID=UPI003FA6ACB7
MRTIHKRFDHGRIRDFVPLLVEKAARRDLENAARPVRGGAHFASPAVSEISGRGLSPLPVPSGQQKH